MVAINLSKVCMKPEWITHSTNWALLFRMVTKIEGGRMSYYRAKQTYIKMFPERVDA